MKEYVFTHSVVIEADNVEEAKKKFTEHLECSKDMLTNEESEVDFYTIHEEA